MRELFAIEQDPRVASFLLGVASVDLLMLVGALQLALQSPYLPASHRPIVEGFVRLARGHFAQGKCPRVLNLIDRGNVEEIPPSFLEVTSGPR